MTFKSNAQQLYVYLRVWIVSGTEGTVIRTARMQGEILRATVNKHFLLGPKPWRHFAHSTMQSRLCGYVSPDVVHLVQGSVPLNGCITRLSLLQTGPCSSALKHTLYVAVCSLDDAIERPHGWNENHLKTIMRGRMTVFQFLVILTVKVNSTAAPAHPHSPSTYSVYDGGWQDPDGRGHCMHVWVNAALSVCHVSHHFRGLRIPGSGSSAAPLHGARRSWGQGRVG